MSLPSLPETLRGELSGFDLVLSDMGPDTSGIRHMIRRGQKRCSSARCGWLSSCSFQAGTSSASCSRPDFPPRRCRTGWRGPVVKPQGSRKTQSPVHRRAAPSATGCRRDAVDSVDIRRGEAASVVLRAPLRRDDAAKLAELFTDREAQHVVDRSALATHALFAQHRQSALPMSEVGTKPAWWLGMISSVMPSSAAEEHPWRARQELTLQLCWGWRA